MLDEMDLTDYFPQGCQSALVCRNPFTHTPYPHAFRVYFQPLWQPGRLNQSTVHILRQPWIGNIVVVKYGRNNDMERVAFGNVQRYEVEHMSYELKEWATQSYSDLCPALIQFCSGGWITFGEGFSDHACRLVPVAPTAATIRSRRRMVARVGGRSARTGHVRFDGLLDTSAIH